MNYLLVITTYLSSFEFSYLIQSSLFTDIPCYVLQEATCNDGVYLLTTNVRVIFTDKRMVPIR